MRRALFLPLLSASMAAFLFSGYAQAFDIEAATQAYLAGKSAEDIARTNSYVNTGYLIMVLDVIAAVLVAWLLLSRGWSRRWRDMAENRFSSRFVQALIYMPIYVLVTTALLFPLTWFSEFHTEHKYGLATQTFPAWFSEFLIGTVVAMILFSLFVALLYAIIRRTQERWWAWGALLGTVFLLFVIVISPVYLQPLFNEYRPMDEGPLKERILSIARANGMNAEDVKQVDSSKQTTRVSANVSGAFGTMRIALNDNLLNQASEAGVEAVMAHEIGHYVLNHMWKRLILFMPLMVVLFLLAHLIFKAITRRKGEAWGIRGIDDLAGLPLLLAIITVLELFTIPVIYRSVYVAEYEADLFAINATQNPDAWAEVALMTAQYRKLHPPEWEENWLNHHPSPYQRIYMAMRWKAENLPDEEDTVEVVDELVESSEE